MNQIRTVLQRMFGLVKHHVGTDQFGNKYYYVPEQKSWTGQTIRSKRMIEAVNRKEIEYEVGNIPSEWEVGVRTPCVTRSGLHDWLGYEGAGRTHQPKSLISTKLGLPLEQLQLLAQPRVWIWTAPPQYLESLLLN
ncbi:NADH dehydrogenase [ubiquinone] 1 alpha subcomplex assembly factor 2 isoform X4 [Stegostoma tigrinum]|uniref:NADH dehydrogenase [ubiquinone] 1 alpha subcomplex assembly factor 2 isoform X4 n=1 Tax=Stegostoma tigrinum TaxID=3053191 RepID=UPI0028709D1A|nr:NADH dehydrogenase [ubiquinone] 1 alpha subcomplex assembly factor 2 isoform X4 [Stegostoma tigrinum]